MRETDLDGKGRWTRQAVRERYGRYGRILGPVGEGCAKSHGQHRCNRKPHIFR